MGHLGLGDNDGDCKADFAVSVSHMELMYYAGDSRKGETPKYDNGYLRDSRKGETPK